jgi:hypothetical protein
LTKEVPASWRVSVSFEPEEIIVRNRKQEQCVKNMFRYELEVEFRYDADTYECKTISLKVSIGLLPVFLAHVTSSQITNLMFHKLCHEGKEKTKKALIRKLLRDYVSDEVLEASETRYRVLPPPLLFACVCLCRDSEIYGWAFTAAETGCTIRGGRAGCATVARSPLCRF